MEPTGTPDGWFKSLSKKVGFTKDLFSSIKDAGLIIFVAAFIIDHQAVFNWLNDYGLSLKTMSPFPGVTLETLDRGREVLQQAKAVEESIPEAKRQEFAENTQKLQASLVKMEQEVLKTPEAKAATDWAVVISGFKNIEDATKEVKQLSYTSLSASIFKKRNSFRVLSVVKSGSDASSTLAAVRSQRKDAYLVSLNRWCGESRQTVDDITTCTDQ